MPEDRDGVDGGSVRQLMDVSLHGETSARHFTHSHSDVKSIVERSLRSDLDESANRVCDIDVADNSSTTNNTSAVARSVT
jgi:hypothetical protein